MPTTWRQFELLVARIEAALVPTGASVKSPDRIRDLVTGNLREVDASIRMDVGSTTLLITIECRRRRHVQDDTWIEQLATKRQKIGAAKTIAVSASGFSEAATKTAQMHGIDLRTLEDRIGEELVQHFLAGFKIDGLISEYSTEALQVQLEDGTWLGPDRLGPDLAEAMREHGPKAVVARHLPTGRGLTVDQIMKRCTPVNLPEDGTPVPVRATATLRPGEFVISTTQGPAFIRGLSVLAAWTRRRVAMPPSGVYEYAAPGGPPLRRVIAATGSVSATEEVHLHLHIESPALDRREQGDVPPTGPPDDGLTSR